MSSLKDIPVVAERSPRSGEKYTTPQGFTAIKDGQKPRGLEAPPTGRKPAWIRAPLPVGRGFGAVKDIVSEHRLATVCEEAKCPNIGECWNAGTATIMLMGAVCTRACRFCSVDTGNPRGWLDPEEPENTARSVELMKLKYIVLTSVNRDDLPDGGAEHYAAAIRAIKRRTPQVAVEALTPDFQGVLKDVETVVDSGLEVFAQNVETVKRLTHPVRDPRAGYQQTIDVLAHAKKHRPSVLTKTSLMLGLGETDEEIAQCMDDLRAANVDLLTLGQYLRPTVHHLPVQRFVTPAQFDEYRQWALAKGFRECVSGPLVRSSYRAEQALAGNNAGLDNGGAGGGVREGEPGKLASVTPDVSETAEASFPGSPSLTPPLVRWLGRVDYEPTWREMQRITDTRDADTPDEIWLLEHPPVFTLGLNADAGHVLAAGDIPVVKIDRGGQVTYHGPGQLVVYPLIDIRRARLGVRDLVTAMERAIIEYCATLGITAKCKAGAPGVYVDGRKIASVGIRIRRGASYHGLAFNVNMDLEPFQRINPCGYAGLEMTQLAALGQPDASVESTGRAFAPFLQKALEQLRDGRSAASCG
ncbi:MAG TPA: lipoyl synthase [Steroidobacteraceae bacterium]|nr:lipoyl synthase [Steroidobacteraceae bacterium]